MQKENSNSGFKVPTCQQSLCKLVNRTVTVKRIINHDSANQLLPLINRTLNRTRRKQMSEEMLLA